MIYTASIEGKDIVGPIYNTLEQKYGVPVYTDVGCELWLKKKNNDFMMFRNNDDRSFNVLYVFGSNLAKHTEVVLTKQQNQRNKRAEKSKNAF
jgi:hypothetical protein